MNQPSGKNKKILIVEDNKLDQKAVTKVLDEQACYQYTIVGTLREAKEKLRETTTFDLVLLDANLPDGMSSELFDELTGKTPFLIATGRGSEDFAVRAYQAGASDYIIKDVDRFYLKLLPSTIEKALKQKELDQLKDSFISTVSHEMRTPLTVIGLGVSNLLDGLVGTLSEKQRQVLERNQGNVKRLSNLINNLLDLSRLQSGKTCFQPQRVDLAHLIHEVIQNFQSGGNGEIVITEQLSATSPPVQIDPDLIAQVVTNLLSNSIRYAKRKILVSVEVVGDAFGDALYLRATVSNDGPGILKERLREVFEKFVQLDREQRRGSYRGTGLGLAICKEIIQQHRGKIWAENVAEGGVMFHFTLPIDGKI